MWPLGPATLLFGWENGLSLPGRPLVMIYWDASPLAVGLSIRTRPDQIWKTAGMRYDQATTIVTFSDPLEAQVHRESAGAPISSRILHSLMDLNGWRILFVNNCLPVILALRKGSASARLQEVAETVALGVLEASARASFLHIPGMEMIAAGTDGASRDAAKRVVGPSCSTEGRNRIRSFLHEHGWEVTIDLLAADCNKILQPLSDEPNSESVDAFSIPSWDQSRCPCGAIHRETAFIFPPKGLEKAVFRRARTDGVRAVSVVPTAYTTGYWRGLRARSPVTARRWHQLKGFHRGLSSQLGSITCNRCWLSAASRSHRLVTASCVFWGRLCACASTRSTSFRSAVCSGTLTPVSMSDTPTHWQFVSTSEDKIQPGRGYIHGLERQCSRGFAPTRRITGWR